MEDITVNLQSSNPSLSDIVLIQKFNFKLKLFI